LTTDFFQAGNYSCVSDPHLKDIDHRHRQLSRRIFLLKYRLGNHTKEAGLKVSRIETTYENDVSKYSVKQISVVKRRNEETLEEDRSILHMRVLGPVKSLVQ